MEMAQYGLTFMCDNPEDLYFFGKALYFDPLVWLFGMMVFAIFLFIPRRPIEHGLSSYDFKMNNNTSRYPDGEN